MAVVHRKLANALPKMVVFVFDNMRGNVYSPTNCSKHDHPGLYDNIALLTITHLRRLG